MLWQNKYDSTIRYEAEEFVIDSTTGKRVYRVEDLGDIDPDFWEEVYEPVEDGT